MTRLVHSFLLHRFRHGQWMGSPLNTRDIQPVGLEFQVESLQDLGIP